MTERCKTSLCAVCKKSSFHLLVSLLIFCCDGLDFFFFFLLSLVCVRTDVECAFARSLFCVFVCDEAEDVPWEKRVFGMGLIEVSSLSQ